MNLYETVKEGQKYGKWTVTNDIKKRGSSKYVLCLCECGLKNYVLIYDLIRNKSVQCKSCSRTKVNLKHGQNCHGEITYEYRLWQNLKHQKLLNDDWKNNFTLFFKDIGKCPQENFILLRKNINFLHSISNSFWGHTRLKFFKDIQGKKFGKWKVVEMDLLGKNVRWLCECDCGKKDYIPQRNLISSISTQCKSCAMIGKNQKKHGHSHTSMYHTFSAMKQRCYNKKNKNFAHYGGRGIKICDKWLESVENFIKDMGEKPSTSHSIDRIDVNGNYSPENCKWSTQKEQTLNQRKMLDVQNEVLKLREELNKYKLLYGDIPGKSGQLHK